MGQYTSKPASQVKGSVKPEKPAYLSVEDTTYLGESFTKEKVR